MTFFTKILFVFTGSLKISTPQKTQSQPSPKSSNGTRAHSTLTKSCPFGSAGYLLSKTPKKHPMFMGTCATWLRVTTLWFWATRMEIFRALLRSLPKLLLVTLCLRLTKFMDEWSTSPDKFRYGNFSRFLKKRFEFEFCVLFIGKWTSVWSLRQQFVFDSTTGIEESFGHTIIRKICEKAYSSTFILSIYL